MANVYVEVGTIKLGVPDKHKGGAQIAMSNAITAAVKKAGSGLTTVKPPNGKGIQVNVQVFKLKEDGNTSVCVLVPDLLELPTKQRFTIAGSVKGEGKAPGKLDIATAACVGAAVADLMTKIGPSIAGSQAPATTGTAASKSPLIYMAPIQLDLKNVPPTQINSVKQGITKMVERKLQANPTRFTQDSTKFTVGSQMPAYTLGITAVSVSFDPTAKQAVATVNWTIADHPSGSTNVLKASASAKQPGTIKPPSDSDKGQLLIDAAEAATDAAIKHLLQKHP